MRFGLTSLLIYVSAFAVLLGINVPAKNLIVDEYVLPCVNTGFQGVPSGYEDRIPVPPSGTNQLRFPLPKELWAKKIIVSRGWPFEFYREQGFGYELDDGSTWVGFSYFPEKTSFSRFSPFAFLVNCLVVLLPAMILDRVIRRVRRFRQDFE